MKAATIELPDPVFQRLTREAELRHQSLATYLVNLLTQKHGQDHAQPGEEPQLPLVRSRHPGSLMVSNEGIARLEADSEAEHHAGLTRR